MLPTGVDWGLRLGELLKGNGRNTNAKVFTYSDDGGADFDDPQAAIDACEDYRGDTILVLPRADGASHKVDELITFDCPGLQVFAADAGYTPEAKGEAFTICPASTYTDGPAVKVTAPTHFRGLGFTTRNVSSGDEESAGMQIEGTGGFSGGFVWLEECRFSCWYGAQEYGIYIIGGAMIRIEHCTFDGLFGGFGTAAIGADDNGTGTSPSYCRIVENYFEGLGSGIPAVKFITGAVPVSFLMKGNINLDGFAAASANLGILLDNNSVVSGGMVCDNWTACADKATAFTNLTNSNLKFVGNHYVEA